MYTFQESQNVSRSAAFLITTTLFFLSASSASAATLKLSPASGSYAVGDTLIVSVRVTSSDQAMNAASGVVTFPANLLQVVSISKNSSIMTLWVQEPSFSNSAGTVNFEGVILNPGFTGANGNVANITFKVKRAGTASINITNGSVLANDGNGTEISSGVSGSSLTLADTALPTDALAPVMDTTPVDSSNANAGGVPATSQKLTITSSTHPDSSAWYRETSGKFAWGPLDGVTAVRVLLSRFPQATPTILYEPPIAGKTLPDIPDGILYLHVQTRTDAGWGGVASKRIQIDTIPPTLTASALDRADASDPAIDLSVVATDKLSGIASYALSIDNGLVNPITLASDLYKTGALSPGHHALAVAAIDRARNQAKSLVEVDITPLQAPIITSKPSSVALGATAEITGASIYPGATARLTLKQGDAVTNAEAPIKTDGTFTVSQVHDIVPGDYTGSVVVVDSRGAQSSPSASFVIRFEGQMFYSRTLDIVKNIGSVLALSLVIAGLVVLCALLYLGFLRYRKSLHKELHDVDVMMHKSLLLLRENVDAYVKELEGESGKRKLSATEARFVKEMKHDLAEAEKVVEKEIHDVEDKVS